jgi:hypothetical protein
MLLCWSLYCTRVFFSVLGIILCHLQMGIVWLLPFLFLFLLSFSSYLIALARNSKTMLIKSVESGHPCLIHDFRGNGFSFSPFSMILAICLLHIAFMLRYILSTTSFIRAIIMKGCWILLKDFSVHIEIIMWL